MPQLGESFFSTKPLNPAPASSSARGVEYDTSRSVTSVFCLFSRRAILDGS